MRSIGAGVNTFAIALLTVATSTFVSLSWITSGRSARADQANSSQPSDVSVADIQATIRALIHGHDRALPPLTTAERTELEVLYGACDSRLWHDASGRLTSDAREAWSLLDRAAEEGLDPNDYHLDLLLKGPDAVAGSPADRTRVDVALSAGMLRYLRHLHGGRVDPRSIGFRLDVPPHQDDFPALLRTAIGRHQVANMAATLRPPYAQYALLRGVLAAYRSMAVESGIVEVRPSSKPLRPGDSFSGAASLRQLLVALGDVPADAAATPIAERYDGVLVQGMKRFQLRHGLAPDGVLGKSTFEALRVPITWRVRQIELALERLRWLPHLGDQRLIALNIPMFRLWAWDGSLDRAPVFGMDVIVGRALHTQTPIFVEEMQEVIFRPYWNVPPGILRHEVIPKIARDPDYLRRENMEIVHGTGDAALSLAPTAEALDGLRRGVLRIRQRPGPHNALGLIKFDFPNRENVYMHGTPAQALFARSRRDFSHGCVRVADPVSLAEWVLKDLPQWTRDRILSATLGTQTVHVRLAHPIQVVLFYTTAAVMPEDGTIRFAEDIYGHDARLDGALAARSRASAIPRS